MNFDSFPDPIARDQITTGLRQLADYLDNHPDIPVAPYGWDLLVATHLDSDTHGIAEIDRVAAILGVPAENEIPDNGHYSALRAFGPITYRAFHIPAKKQAIYRAHMTYADSVTPDDPPQAA